jgi:hypothetical protein
MPQRKKLANQLANRKEDGTEKKDENGNVAGAVKTTNDKFIQLRLFFDNHPNEKFRKGNWKLLTKKGALPYEYVSPEHYT